jgi:hypothetical protein
MERKNYICDAIKLDGSYCRKKAGRVYTVAGKENSIHFVHRCHDHYLKPGKYRSYMGL